MSNEGEEFNFSTETEQVCGFHDCENIVPVGSWKLLIGGPQIVCPDCHDRAMTNWLAYKRSRASAPSFTAEVKARPS